jgi:hypothetical protein
VLDAVELTAVAEPASLAAGVALAPDTGDVLADSAGLGEADDAAA